MTTLALTSGYISIDLDYQLFSVLPFDLDMEALVSIVNNGTSYSKDQHFLLTKGLAEITAIIGDTNATTKRFQRTFDERDHNIKLAILSIFYFYVGIFGNVLGAEIKNFEG